MVKHAAKTVDEILGSLEPPRKETTENIRSMVKRTIPDTTETVRHGRTMYILEGKDLLSIRPTHSHVDLLFVCGTTCGSRLLTGRESKNKLRHVRIRDISDLDESELIRLLKEAKRVG